MPNWETFTKQSSRGAKEPRVNLTVRRTFILNQPAYEELGKPEAVELLFDKKARLIGFKPSTTKVKHAYAVRKQGKYNAHLVAAKAFCTFYDISVTESIRFENIKIQDGVMVLDLNKTTNVGFKKK